MDGNKNFTSSPVAKKLVKAFGANQKVVKVPVRPGQDAKKFIADLNAAYEATQESTLQFG